MCCIIFGSRAKRSAEKESDLDILIIGDFTNFNPNLLLIDDPLIIAATTGASMSRFDIRDYGKGKVHCFLWNWDIIEQKLLNEAKITDHPEPWVLGLISDKLIFGNEPLVGGCKPLIRFIVDRVNEELAEN